MKLMKNSFPTIIIGLFSILLVFNCCVAHTISSSDISCRSEDGKVWMEVDTLHNALLGHVELDGVTSTHTLVIYGPEMENYPKSVHALGGKDKNVYLLIYSYGHLLYLDEALACTIDKDGLKPASIFNLDGILDSVVSCMWYDQLVEASEGFPYDSLDENRFGIHYDQYTKRLFIPILDNHDLGSEFANTSCLQYTGRFEILHYDGNTFVRDGTDGAWWLHPELRNYKRTVSNKKTADGIEQVDLMPDGAYRRTFWKGAKTLDDLRKNPDVLNICKRNDV